MTIKNNIQAVQQLDESPKEYKKPKDILGESGLLKQLIQTIMERALPAEPTHHLGYVKHDPSGNNSRNGRSAKALKTDLTARNSHGPPSGIACWKSTTPKKTELRCSKP